MPIILKKIKRTNPYKLELLKKMTYSLVDENQNYKKLYKTALEGICRVEKGIIINCNDKFLGYFNLNYKEAIKKKISDIIGINVESIKDKISNGKKIEIKIMLPKMSNKLFSILFIPIDGKKEEYYCCFLDISRELFLNKYERDFKEYFNNIESGMAVVNLDGYFLEVNDKLCKITDYSREELLSKNFQEITYPDDLTEDLNFVSRMINQEIKSYSMNKRYVRKDGSVFWAFLSVVLTKDEENNPLYFISTIQEINKYKDFEKLY